MFGLLQKMDRYSNQPNERGPDEDRLRSRDR